MKRVQSVLPAVFTAAAQAAAVAWHPTALAETTWQKLERGIDVVRECSGDVLQYCKGVTPGEGRIKACMGGHLANLSQACLKALAEPVPDWVADGANAKPIRINNSHRMRFIEMYLAAIDPKSGDVIANCYGSYIVDPMPANRETAPQALVETINLKQLTAQYGGLGASLNGPKIWTPDWFDIEVGVTRQFGEMKLPWTAQVNLGRDVDVNKAKPYEPKRIARKSQIGWNKGTQVMLLDDPAGNTWIMKGFQLGMEPKQAYEQFMAAGPANFKKLPPGWKARVVTLKQDNIETPEGGVATILADEFFNVYDKTGPGMSNSKP